MSGVGCTAWGNDVWSLFTGRKSAGKKTNKNNINAFIDTNPCPSNLPPLTVVHAVSSAHNGRAVTTNLNRAIFSDLPGVNCNSFYHSHVTVSPGKTKCVCVCVCLYRRYKTVHDVDDIVLFFKVRRTQGHVRCRRNKIRIESYVPLTVYERRNQTNGQQQQQQQHDTYVQFWR